jgi:hypothetical protein
MLQWGGGVVFVFFCFVSETQACNKKLKKKQCENAKAGGHMRRIQPTPDGQRTRHSKPKPIKQPKPINKPKPINQPKPINHQASTSQANKSAKQANLNLRANQRSKRTRHSKPKPINQHKPSQAKPGQAKPSQSK